MYEVNDSMLTQEEKKEARYKGAETLERVGKYEWAADAYESLARDFKDEKLYDKARELRDKARGLQVKIISTSVDINELIHQLKESGVAISYSCPNCSGSLSISGETKPESLTQCKYCGSTIEKVNLPDILRKALS